MYFVKGSVLSDEDLSKINIVEYVGERRHQLRKSYGIKEISQRELAEMMGVGANTISRWETGTFKVSIVELGRLAKIFSISIAEFFPIDDYENKGNSIQELMLVVQDMSENDIRELTLFAEFRKVYNRGDKEGDSE